MPPKQRNIEGHPQLPGLEKRPGLVHLLTPESAGILPEDYEDITPEMVAFAEPSLLRGSLLDVRRDGRSVVWFTPGGATRPLYLAVNPEDYNGVARNVHWLNVTTVNKTLGTYSKPERTSADVQGKATRSGIHAVENKLAVLEERRADLQAKYALITRFKEMAEPKHRNLTRGPSTREKFHELMGGVVDEMVYAIGNHRRYDSDAMDRMQRTITKRLYIEPADFQARADYFGAFMDLAEDYFGNLSALYSTRVYESKRFLRSVTNQ